MSNEGLKTRGATDDARPESAESCDPSTWVDEHGDAMYRYALIRLQDPALAEEAVQEAFLAGLEAKDRFQASSSERTWLIGILKRKIIDHYRTRARSQRAEHEDEQTPDGDDFFDNRGKWKTKPLAPANEPRSAVEQREFWDVFMHCLSELPRRLADTFCLRELEDMTTDEICKLLGITPTNLWVILHRSRAKLRHCIEVGWFGRKGGTH